MKRKKILFLTSTNLACNPRCLKEIRLLHPLPEVEISLVAFELHNWTTQKEKEILASLPGLQHTHLETTSKGGFQWLVASALEKLSRSMVAIFPNSIFWSALVVGKRSWILAQYLQRLNDKPDLIIAHNPPAFYPAWKLAQQHDIPFALDIEDYHPGESNPPVVNKAVQLLIQQLLPISAYNSYAAPLIQSYTEKLFPQPLRKEVNFTVVNSFSAQEFIPPVPTESLSPAIQLVWFSQFVDYGRGLEKILPVLDELEGTVELTLIGSMRSNFFNHEISSRKYIRCLDALPQNVLHQTLATFDVGLALEDGAADLNRSLCLTNKIWSYLQAGLYILASDTPAQIQFQATYPSHAMVCSLETASMQSALQQLLMQKDVLRQNRLQRFQAATAAAWEQTAVPLLQHWEGIVLHQKP